MSAPEHPDAAASPCQLVRVGPRLSRSHSLDEAFVPLSQKTYFVPTPSTPAPTPIMNKEKGKEKNRRKGVYDVPVMSNMSADARRASTSTHVDSLSSNASTLNRDFTIGRHSIPGYGKRVNILPSEGISTPRKSNTIGRYAHTSIPPDTPTLSPNPVSKVKSLLPVPDGGRHGRKSEPSLPASYVTPFQYSDSRRHTLPVRPAMHQLYVPPAFNTTSWDALPPAEEVEVMEDKPLQFDRESYSSAGKLVNFPEKVSKEVEVMEDKPLQFVIKSDSSAGKLINFTEKVSKDEHKFFSLPPVIDVSFNSSHSVNSSLSSLSDASDRDDFSEFSSVIVTELSHQQQHQQSAAALDSGISQDDCALPCDQLCMKTRNDSVSNDGGNLNKGYKNSIEISSNFSTENPSPLSSPEPITAQLQLRPLAEDSTDKELVFSVVIPEHQKRKKRKARPKRYSDTCLFMKSSRGRKVSRNASAACNFTRRPADCSDDSSPEFEDSKDFLRYCINYLSHQQGELRNKGVNGGRDSVDCDPNELFKPVSCTDGTLFVPLNPQTRKKILRRSRSECYRKKTTAFKTSRSFRDVSHRHGIVVSV